MSEENSLSMIGFKPVVFSRSSAPIVITIKGKSKFEVRFAISHEVAEKMGLCQGDFLSAYVSTSVAQKRIMLSRAGKGPGSRSVRRNGSVLSVVYPFSNDFKAAIPANALLGKPKVVEVEGGRLVIDCAGCEWERRVASAS